MKHVPNLIIALAVVVASVIYSASSQAYVDTEFVGNQITAANEKDSFNIETANTPLELIDDIQIANVELKEDEDVFLDEVTIEDNKKPVTEPEVETEKSIALTEEELLIVPFYSQFNDITAAEWKKVGCGITSLAMIIDYYQPKPPLVDTLLQEGIKADAYISNAGWTYAGLIGISKKYGLTGQSYDLGAATMDSAFNSLQAALTDGPVIVSVHYKFEPENPIPHLVVANGVRDGKLYYNDPAAEAGNLFIPISTFKAAWKKRYIEIRPIS